MSDKAFEEKVKSRLFRLTRQDLEAFVGNVLEEKNFLRLLIETMTAGVVVMRSNLEVTWMNAIAMNMLGIDERRKVVGSRLPNLTRLDELNELLTRFALDGQTVENRQMTLPTDANEPDRVVLATLISADGLLTEHQPAAVLLLRDVTEMRANEEKARHVERIGELSQMAAGLAHEIKNPLNSLQIHAQLMKRSLREASECEKPVDVERLTHSSDVIFEEIQRLGQVVNDFLAAVRPTQPLTKRVNLNTIIEHVADTVRPECDSRGIALSIRLDHEIPSILLDKNQLTQAIMNLVTNAMDAVSQSDSGTVELRTHLGRDSIYLGVKDNGCGIAAEQMTEIFRPFYTTKFHGTGLGLANVQRVIQEHGGTLHVASRVGEGTTMTIALPLAERAVRMISHGGNSGDASSPVDQSPESADSVCSDSETPNSA